MPDEVELPNLEPSASSLFQPFQPPTFGVTFLGTSHGFDANGQTTGFVIWINGKGVMVDPPPHSSLLLRMMGIPPRLIDTLVLTHCHADHDAGTLQKVLEEGQVTIMATKTVMGSFVKKYASLMGVPASMFRELFKFRPVRIGAFMPYRSAHFRFFYSLHAIPCTGFEVHLGGESVVYSADTLNQPESIQKMFEAGVMTAGRRDALINFPWYHSVVLHEAGVPPIHTPISYLSSLPEAVRRRIRLVHVTAKSVPADSGLQLAKEGPENTIRLNVHLPPLSQAVNILDLVSNLRFLQQLSLADTRLLLQLGYVRTFAAGKPITVRHSMSPLLSKHNEFFMIASGIVRLEVVQDSAARATPKLTRARSSTTSTQDHTGFYTIGDFFPRELLQVEESDKDTRVRADKLVATAQTEVQCVVFNEYEFWRFLTEKGVLATPSSVAYAQSEATVNLNSVFASMTSRQRKALRGCLESVKEFEPGTELWGAGSTASQAFLIKSGTCAVVSPTNGTETYGAGALLADVGALRGKTAVNTTVRAVSKVVAFTIPASGFTRFLLTNPVFFLATSRNTGVATV